MKKSYKSLVAFAVVSLFAAGYVFAAEGKSAAAEAKVAGCCVKAKADGKDCSHACCVESAKAGNNCTKCGGAGAIAKQKKKDK